MQLVFVNQPEVPERETSVLPQFLCNIMEHDNLDIKNNEPGTGNCTFSSVTNENGTLKNKHTENKLSPKIMFETNGITDDAKEVEYYNTPHIQYQETKNENVSQIDSHENRTTSEEAQYQPVENHVSNDTYCTEEKDDVICTTAKDCSDSGKSEGFLIPTVNSNVECSQLTSEQNVIELKDIDDCILSLKENDYLNSQKDVKNKTTRLTEFNDAMVYIESEIHKTKEDEELDITNRESENVPNNIDCIEKSETKLNIEDENVNICTKESLQNEKCNLNHENLNEDKSSSVVIDTLDLLLSDDEKEENKNEKVEYRSKEDCKNSNELVNNDDNDLLLVSNTKNNKDSISSIILDDDDDEDISNKLENEMCVNEENDLKKCTNIDSESINLHDNKDCVEEVVEENINVAEKKSEGIELTQNIFGTIKESDVKIENKISNEPILSLDFMKNFKHIFGKMTRENLEEFCVVKMVEAINRKSNLGELEARLKTQINSIEVLRKTLSIVTKQNRDLEIVVKNLTNEHKKRKLEIIEPVKISRSVGFQVGPSSLRSKLNKPSNSQSTNIKNNSNSQKTHHTNMLNTPTTSNAVTNSPVDNTNINKKINVITPQRNVHVTKTDSKYQKTSQKSNVSKHSAEKRLADQSIDLTDDEPPTKLLAVNNNRIKPSSTAVKTQNAVSPVSNSPRSVLLSSQLPNVNSYNPNVNKLVIYQKMNSNAQQGTSPVSMIRSVNNTDTAIRLGIPIKTTGTSPTVQSYNYGSYKRHPAPLPVSPSLRQTNPCWKWAPPRPELKISKVNNGIVISWIMENEMDSRYEDVASYQIYAYQETSSPPSTDLWKKIGDVTALPLPMACTLTQFIAGYKYYFAVRAVDVKQRIGAFSAPAFILLTNE